MVTLKFRRVKNSYLGNPRVQILEGQIPEILFEKGYFRRLKNGVFSKANAGWVYLISQTFDEKTIELEGVKIKFKRIWK